MSRAYNAVLGRALVDISIRILSLMATITTSLKVSYYLLLNHKSDGAETWWKA